MQKNRVLGIFDITEKEGKNWIVVDRNTNEILSVKVREIIHDYSFEGKTHIMYEPVMFKKLSFAQNFVDGKTTIADIQESLHELNVCFTSKMIH